MDTAELTALLEKIVEQNTTIIEQQEEIIEKLDNFNRMDLGYDD